MNIELKELSLEEKAKPYSKYYYKKPASPDPASLARMEQPIDPAEALPVERINNMLSPGYFKVEAGWCGLPQGGLYIANHTKMPGVSVDMINWWFAWHSLEDLRYKIWWPAGHFAISISDTDRKKVLDPKTPATQKFQGITHHVTEDVGGPCAEKIAISFLTPGQAGFDMSRFKSPNVATVAAANGVSVMLNPPPGIPDIKTPAFMMHVFREIPGGIELRTRFWIGCHILDKKPCYSLPEDVKLPEIAAKGLAMHNVLEYSNLASFLPQIYEEQNGIVE